MGKNKEEKEIYNVLNDLYNQNLKEMPTFDANMQKKIKEEIKKAFEKEKEQH